MSLARDSSEGATEGCAQISEALLGFDPDFQCRPQLLAAVVLSNLAK